MQREFGEVLRDQRDQPRIVRPRRDFAENYFIAAHKQLDAEQAVTAQRIGNFLRHVLRSISRRLRHRLRLPRFLIIARFLPMADGFAEAGAADMAHGKQSDFIIEIDEAFDDDGGTTRARFFTGNAPGFVDITRALNHALAFAGGAHDRFYNAGDADGIDRCTEFGFVGGKPVG